MKLTIHTDLSLRVMMYLAIKSDELIRVKEIAEAFKVSRNHLVKVVHKLSTFGYLKTTKGRGGGIALAVPAEEIIVGDIIRTMESTMDIIDCKGKTSCTFISACLLKGVLNEATNAFLKSLDQYTVADLVRNKPRLLKLLG